ncbi:MAG: hypothetical protein PVJ84_12495 [Desulfobacteraceae bacterium]|jgi:hypothetical protein
MSASINKHWWIVVIFGILSWAMVACATTGERSREKAPMTLAALFDYCGIPSSCDSAAAWENRWVTIVGYVDPDNIFHKERYPSLPYEKFRLIDRKGKSIEVWIKSSDSRTMFSKVLQKKNSPIIIRGRLAVVKMPVMGACRLSAKVWIDDPSQIQ